MIRNRIFCNLYTLSYKIRIYYGVDNFNHRVPFLLPLVFLSTGILCGNAFHWPITLFYIISGITLLCGIFFFKKSFSAILIYTSILLCGQQLATPPDFNPEPSEIYLLHGRCKDVLSPGNYIFSAANKNFHIRERDPDAKFQAGDSLKIYGRIIPLGNAGNTGAFNYNRYLKQKNIHYRIYPSATIVKTGYSPDLYTFFQHIRQKLISKTDSLLKNPKQQAVIKALCLGYKNDLDNDTRNLFSSTGTIHLLAVSGLHTGAVYLLLCYLFKRMGLKRPKTHLAIIPLLWCYACLTGMSPSVIRAANILSFIIIGNAFAQDYTPLNSIAASAFLSLLFQPEALHSVSMQMSYAAYTGIVLLYPVFKKISTCIPVLLRPVYALFSVTLSAQIATLPLSAYYFHAFNPYSIFINLVAVPLTTTLFYCAVLFLILPLCIGIQIAWIPQSLCTALFFCLDKSDLLSTNINDLYPTLPYILFLYLHIFLSILYLSGRKKTVFQFLVLNCSFWLIYICSFNIHIHNREEIIVYHLYQKSCILMNNKGYYTYLHNTSDSSDLKTILPYIHHNRLIYQETDSHFIYENLFCSIPVFRYKKHHISILTSDNDFPHPDSKLWIICNNILPDRLSGISPLLPRQIVLDASNRYSCIRKWESFCKNNSIELLKTENHGSIVISLK